VPTRLMKDVKSFVITVSDVEYRRREAEFRAYGYAIRNDGGTPIATGPDISFQLVRSHPNQPRKFTVYLSLTPGNTADGTYKFADESELRIRGDHTAAWTFTFMPPQ
jgi:hypothetical protein